LIFNYRFFFSKLRSKWVIENLSQEDIAKFGERGKGVGKVKQIGFIN
jgi:hypothetical protein